MPFEDYSIASTIETGKKKQKESERIVELTSINHAKGHSANIFSAKFMPQTSDNIIISGAGDSEIRVFDLQKPESPLSSMYICHSDQVKSICVYEDSPNIFLTCSQDGTVKHFDLRVPHVCSPHAVKIFPTGHNKPARQNPIPAGPSVRDGCPLSILNYGTNRFEVNSMTINKLMPQYFAIAGMNDYIYLHDKRMTPTTGFSFYFTDTMSDCVKKFSPGGHARNHRNQHITACKFSDSNGYEVSTICTACSSHLNL